MLGWEQLKPQIQIGHFSVECPVRNCPHTVKRQRNTFQRHADFPCPLHGIYISPSTFEYESDADNMLWAAKDDLELWRAINTPGVKRESRITRDNSFLAGNRTVPSTPGHAKRYTTGGQGWFANVFQPFADFQTVAVDHELYQLMRLWLLGSWIANQAGKRFVLVNVLRSQVEEERDIEARFGNTANALQGVYNQGVRKMD